MAVRAASHLGRRLRRRTAGEAAEAVARELRLRRSARRMELGLARAAAGDRPIIVGPCLAEVGFELLYWIPMVRRLLRQHRISPERVIAVSRGGAEPWYADVAGRYVDVLDLVSLDDLRTRLESRRSEVGDRKQLTVANFDREILEGVKRAVAVERAFVLHPSLMFTRLRHFWSGERGMSLLRRRTAYHPIDPSGRPDGVELPDGYTALRIYFSDCLPDTERNRAALETLVAQLAEEAPVVVMASGGEFDDHRDWRPPAGVGLWLDGLFTPRHNLAQQTCIVAAARRLVVTYGGLSYLGPLTGTPALALYSEDNFNPVHLKAIRTVGADDYRVEELGA